MMMMKVYNDNDDDFNNGDDDDHPALHSLPCEENVGRVVQHNLKQEMSM